MIPNPHFARARMGSVLALAWTLSFTSCTHQVQTASRASRTTVPTVKARRVENAVDAGEGDLEARTLRQRLAANANDLDARILLARMYSRRGLPDLALEHYRFAAARFPEAVGVTLALAGALREMGQTGQALEAVEACLARHPGGNWELYSLQGILEDELGRFGPAEAAHRAALALEPGRSALHNNLGYNLLLQGRPEVAAAELRHAIEIDPRSQIAHNNLGAALASQTHSESGQALAEWQRSSDPAVAHNNLAAVLIEQGRYAEARAELNAALEFRRDFPAALANLKLVAERDGQAATVPAATRPVNLRKRAASKRVAGGTPVPKAAVPGAVGAEGVPADVAPALAGERAGDAPTEAASRK